MNPQEQEHIDHVAGSATEYQNCFAEAQHWMYVRAKDHGKKIQEALDAGLFVNVYECQHYCRVTDALVGTYPHFVAAFKTRPEAELAASRSNRDLCPEENGVYTLPALPVAEESRVFTEDDDVPF